MHHGSSGRACVMNHNASLLGDSPREASQFEFDIFRFVGFCCRLWFRERGGAPAGRRMRAHGFVCAMQVLFFLLAFYLLTVSLCLDHVLRKCGRVSFMRFLLATCKWKGKFCGLRCGCRFQRLF